MSIKVLKFGGTSVGSPEALRLAASIIQGEVPRGGVVVVSALSGTTDRITEAVNVAAQGNLGRARELHDLLWARHLEVANTLGLFQEVEPHWTPLFKRLAGLLEGMGLLWEASPRARDAALAIGETLSIHLVTALLQSHGVKAEALDVRTVMLTDGRHGKARPRLEAIRKAAQELVPRIQAGQILVTQGFVGAAPDGATTTLGRGGSDTSATILGEALGAFEVQIWTDVDGVLTADPSLVKEAQPIPEMSLDEAAALSAFGAKVLHADSLAPVGRGDFRLVVANTHRPQASRTVILKSPPARKVGEITSVAYKEGLVCLRFPPSQDLDAVFLAVARLQDAGATRYGLLSTPEGSLLVVRPEQSSAEQVLRALGSEGVLVERGWSLVALVGEGLHRDPGAFQGILDAFDHEPLGAVLAGGAGVSLAVLVREDRLRQLIPLLHTACLAERPCRVEA